jgi:DNA gyrase inhibitor GyrI
MLAVTETAMDGIGLSIPHVVERPATPSLAYRISGKMSELPQFAPPYFGKLHEWMTSHGVAPGLHFFRYRRFGNDGDVELDVGNAIAVTVDASDGVTADPIPAGRYAFATYTGPYDRLYDAFAMLNGWISARGLKADARSGPDGQHMACQIEFYRISPRDTPDPARHETDILIKLA